MNILDLDFNKPIYVMLADGIHQVKFDRAELIFVKGNISKWVALVRGKIAGGGDIDCRHDLKLTNDLDALVHKQADVVQLFGQWPSYGWHGLGGCTEYNFAAAKQLLERKADFGYSIHRDVVCRYVWDGMDVRLVPYASTGICGISDGHVGLRYDLLRGEFIRPTNHIYIGNGWVAPRWYNTEEECRNDNAIKVFTFEN